MLSALYVFNVSKRGKKENKNVKCSVLYLMFSIGYRNIEYLLFKKGKKEPKRNRKRTEIKEKM